MKRYGHIVELIADYNNILYAYYKALRGHRFSAQVSFFSSELDDNIRKIRDTLEKGEIIIHPFNKFIITDPKIRQICAPTFFDRVQQHAIMNVCHDFFDRRLISDTYASRPGKGVYAALDRIMEFSRRFDLYVKLDVRKYFDSIDHEILKKELARLFKDLRLLAIFYKIIDSYEVLPGKGIPIGNLTSQYFANLYLSKIDFYMKSKYGVRGYIRYMDDVVMFGKNKDEIKKMMTAFISFAKNNLLLEIKPPVLGWCTQGITVLGYKVFSYYMKLSRKGKYRFKNKMSSLFRMLNNGIISQEQFALKSIPLIAFTKHAETLNYRKMVLSKIITTGNS